MITLVFVFLSKSAAFQSAWRLGLTAPSLSTCTYPRSFATAPQTTCICMQNLKCQRKDDPTFKNKGDLGWLRSQWRF